MDEAHKKELNKSTFKRNEVSFEVTFGGPPNHSKT